MNGKDTETQEEAMIEEEKQGRAFERRLLNVEETAAYLGISPRTIYNRVSPKAKNPFPVKAKRLGKRVLFDIQDLDRCVEEL